MFEAILDKKLNADRGFIKPKRKPPEELERLKRENKKLKLIHDKKTIQPREIIYIIFFKK